MSIAIEEIHCRRIVSAALFALASAALVACGGGSGSSDQGEPPLTVQKANCGAGDTPETGLQGQVPAALRASGFKGFSCNLQLVSQVRGDGAGWQSAAFADKNGHTCAYHGTSFNTVNRTNTGVQAIDITDPTKPVVTSSLATTSMLDPWESLKVNERRQLLAGDNAHQGGFGPNGGPEIDIYDLSGDCRHPQLLSSLPVGTGTDGGVLAAHNGHEGYFSPDGLTYYGGDLGRGVFWAADISDTTKPRMIASWTPSTIPGNGARTRVHGLSISDDGTRGYFTQIGEFSNMPDPDAKPTNGLWIVDLTEVQSRKPGAQFKPIGSLFWNDQTIAQMTIPVKIGGKPYIIHTDEGGAAFSTNSGAAFTNACAANMPPFPFARIIDISDETKPKLASKLMLEVNDPANCDKTLPDVVGLSEFTYGSHYCSVDNKQNATTLACGYFSSGIRVFDIRDPLRPKEIAYYNPPGTMTASAGSNHFQPGGWVAGGPDWCASQLHLDAAKGTIWSTCQDNGFVMLKFTNGVWPFPESSTPPGEQN